MAAGLTLDAGALIAYDKADQRMRAILTIAGNRGAELTVPSLVIAQVWRGNSPRIARLLQTCRIEESLDTATARTIGRLLAESRTSDVVDAVVAYGAVRRGDNIATSDPEDIDKLIDAAGRLRGPRSSPIRRHVKVLRV
jgi:predicted nucleic acid-binding protein